MEPKHITFEELCQYANEYFKEYPSRATQFTSDAPKAVIVFSQKSFKRKYSLEARSYKISLANKYFLPDYCGNSIFGFSLDGSDQGIRLDYYLGTWIIDYCYLLTD